MVEKEDASSGRVAFVFCSMSFGAILLDLERKYIREWEDLAAHRLRAILLESMLPWDQLELM